MAKPSPDPKVPNKKGKRAKTQVPKRVKTAAIIIIKVLATPKISSL